MRLLQYDSAGQLSLTKDLIRDNIPEYAILSHTWGVDTEEVTYRDMMDGTGKNRTGYEKIRFCGERAKHDGYLFFWVDTCCIDKSNAVELQEAINSMFRWYQNAAKCYVYLSDVSTRKRKTSDRLSEHTWESAFRSSKWFTRGWTLQELLAPSPDSVEFFSYEGDYFGDKRSLEQQIHEITGIPIRALQGSPLSQFDVGDRLSWARKRQTTREEDEAYSLFGIFDIQIPLLYGERRDKAFNRLQEEIHKPLTSLDCLPSAVDAPFNSYNKQHAPTCLPNTRVDLLQEIYNWADRQDERCVFWLSGLAGTGKSTIARTVARRYYDQKRLGASFFFSKGGGDVGHAGKFFTSFAAQLARNVPQIQRFISAAVIEQNDIAKQSLRDQWRHLVFRPLSRLEGSSSLSSYVLIVDALDECDNEDHIRMILQLLAETRLLKIRLRVLVTSRPEAPIRYWFCRIPDAEHHHFILHNIEAAVVNDDIFTFLHHEMGSIGQEWALGTGWPGESALKKLVVNASGLFIWAATACRFIREGRGYAAKRLLMMLEGSTITLAAEHHLNNLYTTVLKSTIQKEYLEEEKENMYLVLKQVLGALVLLYSPLSIGSLSELLSLPKETIGGGLANLHAILDIPNDTGRPLCLHHPSFRDFLLNKDRCTDPNFWVNEKQAHRTLANNCIRLMSNTLKRDICQQGAPGRLVADVQSSQRERCIPLEVKYACLYWVQHLQKCGAQLYDNDQTHQFLQVHLLHWLEALSWIGKTSEGIVAISSLEAQVQADKSPALCTFVYDAKRFALCYRSIIEQAPLQLYCSLVFTPEKSAVRRQFEESIPQWLQRKPKVQVDWSAVIQTLEGHSSSVRSVAFSPDGKRIVSGSDDRTVRLWDAVTGAALQTLEGHLSSVMSVAFSPDGKLVVSGSMDGTVQLWDVMTGAVLQTFEDHLSSVWSVAFSPDGKRVISGLEDMTVRLWDAVTGVALQTLEGHLSSVKSVAFSPDGKRIVSGSNDKTMRLWDAVTGAELQTLKGHLSTVWSVAFSPDSKRIVSGSNDKTVRLWDAITGAALQTLKGHLSSVRSVAFSPDTKRLVSGSDDRTVQLWDAVTGAALQTLKGHSSWVGSVAFSPDSKRLVSGSYKTVQLWDTVTGAALQTLKGHLNSVKSVAFSPDGKRLVSGSEDRTVQLWDAVTGAPLQTLKGHLSWVNSVAFSPDGKRIVSGSDDWTVRLWDAVIGALLQTLKGHLSSVRSVAFSPDGKRLVSGSDDRTVQLWDAVTGAPLQTLKGHLSSVSFVSFSPDSKRIVSTSIDRTVQLWDAVTGAALETLEGDPNWASSLAFSPDSQVKHWFILNDWIIHNEENILWLPPEYRATCDAVWNNVIVLGHVSGKISILGFKERSRLII